MRNSIDIQPNSDLKGIQSIIPDIGATPGTIFKLSQSNNTIYMIYNPTPDISHNKCQLSSKLCQFNNIKSGSAHLVPIMGTTPICKNAKIYVTDLDWQIINNNSHKLQCQFLNQINLIWPNAQIPLYYDKTNCLKLKIQCENVSLLKQNTELQILILEQKKQAKNQHKDLQIRRKVQKIYNVCQIKFGNINVMEIPQQIYEQMAIANIKQNTNFWINYQNNPDQCFPTHSYNISIKDQLQIIKTNKIDIKKSNIIQQKLPITLKIQSNGIEHQENNTQLTQIYTNKYFDYFMNPSSKYDSINLIGHHKIDKKSSKKLNFMLNSISSFRIKLEVYCRYQQQALFDDIKIRFCQNLLTYLQKNQAQIIIYQKIPFCISPNLIGYISLCQNNSQMSDPITICHYQPITNQLKQKLLSVIQIVNLCFTSENSTSKLNTILKLNQLSLFPKPIDTLFKQMYLTNYNIQIKHIFGLLQDFKTKYIVVTSFANNGKTILHQIMMDSQFQSLYLDMHQINDVSLTSGDVNLFLEGSFQKCKYRYIFFDNIDSVCSKIDAGDLHRKQERIAAKMILRKIKKLSKLYGKKCIFTAKNDANIDEQLSNYELIRLKNPSFEQRKKVLEKHSKQQSETNQKICEQAQSMSFGQFYKFLTTKINLENKKSQVNIKYDFSKLAGMTHAKKMIKSLVQKPLKFNFVFKNLPVKLSRGILLYGGSGTGKTALGEALADEFQMKFFSVKGSDILSKYIGGSQAAVRQIFEKAMSVSPSIIFFDQFQSIVPRRNSSNTGVTDRVVNQFLCYLDGVASIQGVFIIAASSRPQLIDPALLRPGRIDSHIYLEYPTAQEREQLFNLYRNSINFQNSLSQVSQLTDNFSYSDIVGLIKELRIKKASQILSNSQTQGKNFKFISNQFLIQILKTFKVSVSQNQQRKQKQSFIRFKTGSPPDISNQKTILQ